jgi:hypothetical protein
VNFDIDEHTVYLVTYGSHAYGTSTPESDVDVRGFAVAPRSHVQGFAYTFEQCERNPKNGHPDLDSVVYDIRKFCNLAADCNPNIIETLFVDESDIRMLHPAGKLLRDNRDLFISKKARHTFSGYAMAQLKRIRTHRGYVLNPPTHRPTREEFGLSATMKITSDMMGAFDKMVIEDIEVSPNVMELVQKEKQYKAALDRWNQHENWKANRNPKRSEMERAFGFDGKHGLHLVRLLKMCREILEGKGVIVKRPDAAELLAIRRGEMKYDDLISWAEREDAAMQVLYTESTLRKTPDIGKLNDLCVEAQEMFWASQVSK